MPQVSVNGSAAVTSFDDMITMVLTHEHDPEVLKWVASSFFCASNSGKTYYKKEMISLRDPVLFVINSYLLL